MVMAKVNVDEKGALAQRYGYLVKGYPTLLWFEGLRQNPFVYDGGREDKEIVAWVDKMLGKATKREKILA